MNVQNVVVVVSNCSSFLSAILRNCDPGAMLELRSVNSLRRKIFAGLSRLKIAV